jgi:Uma2 family endonuclease
VAHAATQPSLDADAYLAWEALQTERHEYVGGEVYAMAGADDRHVTIAMNVAMALRRHLAGSRCRTYMSDMRVHVAAVGAYFYPDVLVTCSDADRASPLVKTQPLLVVEVLSASTAAYDRGAKFGFYRNLPSLREVALIDPDARTADVYRLGSDGLWVLHPFAGGEAVAGLELGNEQLYADVLDD